MEIVNLDTIDRDYHIILLENKYNELSCLYDETDTYKSWNKFLMEYLKDILYDIDNLKDKTIKCMSLKNINLTSEDIMHRYLMLDVVHILLRYKLQFMELGLYPNIYNETVNEVYPVLVDPYPFKISLFENYAYFWNTKEKFWHKYDIDILYKLYKEFTKDEMEILHKNINKKQRLRVNITAEFDNSRKEKYKDNMYSGFIDEIDIDIFKKIPTYFDMVQLEFEFKTLLGIRSKFIFKNKSLTKDNIIKSLKYESGMLQDINYIKNILKLKEK